jgi:hypothetical protein
MRRDPKDYESIRFLHKLNKHDQEEANRKAQPPHPRRRPPEPKPGDDDFVEDIL